MSFFLKMRINISFIYIKIIIMNIFISFEKLKKKNYIKIIIMNIFISFKKLKAFLFDEIDRENPKREIL